MLKLETSSANLNMKRFAILSLTILLLACGHKSDSNETVYELLDFVIKDQALDKNHGLALEPELRCSLDKTDEEFLKDLVETPISNDTAAYSKFQLTIPDTFYFVQLTKCLSKNDVDYMIQQRDKNKDFNWDNSKLGFNLHNKHHWYVFSVPLISEDRTKAVMMIRDLCKGLCGQCWTLLLTKQNGHWKSERGLTWLH